MSSVLSRLKARYFYLHLDKTASVMAWSSSRPDGWIGHFRTQDKSCTSHQKFYGDATTFVRKWMMVSAAEIMPVILKLLSRLTHMPTNLLFPGGFLYVVCTVHTVLTRWVPSLDSWAFDGWMSQRECIILMSCGAGMFGVMRVRATAEPMLAMDLFDDLNGMARWSRDMYVWYGVYE